ncbi:MAG: T9SS type A sorting domain-containing protein [Bacteroidales bacterium]|nr:T9SS type A sorting domain-containing protein [Bacteroidales bacterium]
MKKIYILLTILLSLSLGLKAQQSFEFSYNGEVFTDTVKINVLPTGREEILIDYIHFKNITSETINARVYRQDIMLNPTASLFMCFDDNCVTDTIPQNIIELVPNVEYTSFDLQYTYTSDAPSIARIHLVDPISLQSLQSFIVLYSNSDISLPKPIKNNTLTLEAYPNPAVQSATINYSLPSNYRQVTLVLRNMIGKELKTIQLSSSSKGKQTINTYDLPNGVYFYSIIGDGKTIATKKLIVKH